MPESVGHEAWCVNSLNSSITVAIRQPDVTLDQFHTHEHSPSSAGQQYERPALNSRHVQLDAESSAVDRHVPVLDEGQRLERPGGLAARGTAVTPPTPTFVAVRRRDARSAIQARRHTADWRRRTSVVLTYDQHL